MEKTAPTEHHLFIVPRPRQLWRNEQEIQSLWLVSEPHTKVLAVTSVSLSKTPEDRGARREQTEFLKRDPETFLKVYEVCA